MEKISRENFNLLFKQIEDDDKEMCASLEGIIYKSHNELKEFPILGFDENSGLISELKKLIGSYENLADNLEKYYTQRKVYLEKIKKVFEPYLEDYEKKNPEKETIN